MIYTCKSAILASRSVVSSYTGARIFYSIPQVDLHILFNILFFDIV